MMKRKPLPGALLSLGLLTMMLYSCSKDDVSLNNPENVYTLKYLNESLKPDPQSFTVTAGTDQVVTGAKGTLIHFHPQSFKDAGGNIITAGSINIELTEMYTPGAMIANRVTTNTASNQRLTSGGSVNIKATLNGQEVYAGSYELGFKQPASSQQPMALFRGYGTTDSTGTSIRWYDDTTGTVDRTVKIDTTQSFYYLFDSCTTFNWINCDYFYTAPSPKTDITVVMPDATYDLTNTQVFVIFPAINSVTALYSYNAATHAFSFGYPSYFVPVGTQVQLLVLGAKNGGYFAQLQNAVTVTNGMTVNAVPTGQTLTYIQSLVAGL